MAVKTISSPSQIAELLERTGVSGRRLTTAVAETSAEAHEFSL